MKSSRDDVSDVKYEGKWRGGHRYRMGIDYPYSASTCDVMHCRQRRHLYYGGENLKYYIFFFQIFFWVFLNKSQITVQLRAGSGHIG
jgi:hypothetical protein